MDFSKIQKINPEDQCQQFLNSLEAVVKWFNISPASTVACKNMADYFTDIAINGVYIALLQATLPLGIWGVASCTFLKETHHNISVRLQ